MECIVEEKVAIQLDLSLKDKENSSDEEELFHKRNTVKTRLFDSDEENEDNLHENNQTSNEVSDVESDVDIIESKSKGRKVVRRFDSDSEEELFGMRQDVKVSKNPETPFGRTEDRPNSETEVFDELRTGVEAISSKGTPENKTKDCIMTSESDDEFDLSLSSLKSKGVMDNADNSLSKINRFSQSDLYDAEGSSDEEVVNNVNDEENPEAQVSNIEETRASKSSKEKQKKPKAKSSKTDLQDIHSESQRMVRESRVSLPYHRPRQRTLAEFLQRRKNTVLPVKSLKTSPAKLGAVWKTLEEKAKEAEEFYKSESDSEPEVKEDEKKNEETKAEESATASEGVDVVNKNQDACSDESVREKEDSNISLDTEKVSSCTEGEPEASTAAQKMDVDPDKGESESVTSVLENVGIAAKEVNTIENSNATIENVLPEVTAVEKEVEQGQLSDKGSGIITPCTDNKEDATTANLGPVDALKKDEISSSDDVNASSVPNEVTEMEVDGATDEIGQKVIEAKSSMVDFSKDAIKSNKDKVTEPIDLEEESISLRLDEDDGERRPDTNTIYDANCRLSESMSKTKQNELQNIEEVPISGNDSNLRKLDSLGKTEESVEEKDISSAEVQNVSSEVSEPMLGRKEQLLKAAGIFLSPQGLPSLKAESDVIDLDEDVKAYPQKEVGVRDLMQRFIKHHIPKKPVVEEKKVNVGLVVVEGGGDQGPEQVKREVMSVTIGGGDAAKYAPPGTERPGARLRCLREELQREIAKKRDEEWAKREKENVFEDEDNEGEDGKGKCNLDDEEEEELTESSSSEEEEEEDEIEDDIDMSTKSRPKSDFVDDEAEESEDDGEADDEDEDNEDDEDVLDEEKEAVKAIQERETGKSKESSENEERTEEADEMIKEVNSPPKKKKLQRVKTLDLFSSGSDNEDEFESMKSPPCTPFSKDRSSGHFHLPSPALPLTALQGSNGFQNSPSASPSSWGFTQKNLFNDEESPRCVKEETNSQRDKSALRRLVGSTQDSQVSEDELLNLMSGNFVSHAPKVNGVDSQDDFCLALEETQDLFDKPKNNVLEESFLDTCKDIKDEKEELDTETFKSEESKDTGKDVWSSASLPANSIGDESDEDDILTASSSDATKRKKLKKLAISDDEDEDGSKIEDEDSVKEGESSKEEEVEESSPENEEEEEVESELDEDDGEERIVEYDSEENAIVVVKEKKQNKARRGLEFLENEAELSEGEEEYFGSGDEDEKGLDRMEREEGDADKLDSEVVHRELERIHMRQVLDEDKREVRLLQEIFLEDGELHSEGMGRERKFRWRNIDNMDDATYRTNDSGDEGKAEEDDETEEQWRRLRHERETWLREHKKDEVEDSNSILKELGEDSILVKLGQAALMRAQKNMSNTLRKWLQTASPKVTEEKDPPKAPVPKEPESPNVKKPFTLTKRGSFLSRKDGTLEKLAEIAIKSSGGVDSGSLTSSSPVVNKAKNSRKFIFTVLSPEKKQPAVPEKRAKEETNSVKKNVKRKRAETSHAQKGAKKTKPVAVNSIFQFL